MKKISILVIFSMLLLSVSLVSAHEHNFTETKQLIDSGISCDKLTDEQLEAMGDYYMEQMHPGEAHEMMDQMMGGEGSDTLKQMHIQMAKRLYCNEDVGGMMNMMMGNNMMGNYPTYYGYNNFCTHLFKKYQYPRMLVHKKDNQKLTALHLAASNGHPSVCSLLIQFGADLFLTNDEGLTPLQITSYNEVKEILIEAETSMI